jgi:hypothetical protein
MISPPSSGRVTPLSSRSLKMTQLGHRADPGRTVPCGVGEEARAAPRGLRSARAPTLGRSFSAQRQIPPSLAARLTAPMGPSGTCRRAENRNTATLSEPSSSRRHAPPSPRRGSSDSQPHSSRSAAWLEVAIPGSPFSVGFQDDRLNEVLDASRRARESAALVRRESADLRRTAIELQDALRSFRRAASRLGTGVRARPYTSIERDVLAVIKRRLRA